MRNRHRPAIDWPGAGVLPVVWLALVAGLAPLTASAGPSRIVHAEPLQPQWSSLQRRTAGDAVTRPAGDATLAFRAFGRSFELQLAPNATLAPASAGFELLAGTVNALPGSWVRVSRRGADLAGLFFDGVGFYAIEPVGDVLEFLDPGVPVPASHNLVYRLEDLWLDADGLACGVSDLPGEPGNAAVAVQALGSELAMMAAVAGPAYRIVVDPLADLEFAGRFGEGAIFEILTRLNIADGIFREQVGVDLVAAEPRVFTSTGEDYPFTATLDRDLLEQVSDVRFANPGRAGLTHLFTGKTFANRVAGMAWQSAACFTRESAAWSTSAGITRTTSALVAAHELGHNFGAPHDGEVGSPCESTASTYLMAPRSSGSDIFSPCSLAQMAPVIVQRAQRYPACLTAVADYDVGLTGPGDTRADPATGFELAFTARNLGNLQATGIRLEVDTPAPLEITGAVAANAGSCDFVASGAVCALTSLEPEQSWTVTLSLQGKEPGRATVAARLSASADGIPANDDLALEVTIGTPPVAGAASDGGGGGGAIGGEALLALGGLAAGRRRGRSGV